MGGRDTERQLLPLRDFEKEAKRLYQANPGAYQQVVWTREEFAQRGFVQRNIPLPSHAAFFMKGMLTEQDCFSDPNSEVSVLLHDRYVPPFYHSLKFIKIVYALRKGFFFYWRENGGDRKVRMEQGDFVIIPPEVSQAVFTGEEGALTVNIIIKQSTFGEAFYSLLMENDRISDFFWHMLYSKGNERSLLVRCGRDQRLKDLVLDICREGILDRPENTAGKNLILKGYVMLLFGIALKEYSGQMESVGRLRESDAALPEVIRYIRENFTALTLPQLAAHFGKSEGYMSRYIRRETGKTFRFLVKELRMRQAVQMLENSSCSMEEIAAAVGYSEISCFYRNFRAMYGVTPMQYRNKRNCVYV